MAKLKKPEPAHVRGPCVIKGCINLQVSNGKGIYKPVCNHHHRLHSKPSKYSYLQFRKDVCERCNFVPEHPGQLECDHINGDHTDNRESNIQTLCLNCHRLKSILAGDLKR